MKVIQAITVEKRIQVRVQRSDEMAQIQIMADAIGMVNLSEAVTLNAPPSGEGYELYHGAPEYEWGWFGGSAALVDAFEQVAKAYGFESKVESRPVQESLPEHKTYYQIMSQLANDDEDLEDDERDEVEALIAEAGRYEAQGKPVPQELASRLRDYEGVLRYDG